MNSMTHTYVAYALSSFVLAAGLTWPALASAGTSDQGPAGREERLLRVQGRTPPQPPKPAPAPRPAPQPRRPGAQQEEVDVRELTLGATGELSLSNIAGDIAITAAKGETARLEIVKNAMANSEAEARRLLELVRVDVVTRGTRVDVSVSHPHRGGPNRRGGGLTVTYTVAVPAGTRVRAQSIAGSISSKGVKGESSYESVSGSIRVAGGGRVVSAKSISGEVELTDTDMDITFQASSASGGITLRRVTARRMDIGSISGMVVLEGVQASAVSAQTVSGDVQFDGPLDREGRYQLRSHSGGIRVGLPSNAGFELDATTFSGSVTTDLPINASAAGGARGRSLRGVHGKGGAILELTTFSGSITIGKR